MKNKPNLIYVLVDYFWWTLPVSIMLLILYFSYSLLIEHH